MKKFTKEVNFYTFGVVLPILFAAIFYFAFKEGQDLLGIVAAIFCVGSRIESRLIDIVGAYKDRQ